MEDKFKQLCLRSIIARVPLCGCGSSTSMWEIVRAILARSRGFDNGASDARDVGFYDPMPGLDLSGTAVEFAAQVLNESDLMEHGSGIGWAWLTKAGLMLLEFLEQHGCDHHDWPEWAESSTGDEPFTMSPEGFKAAGLANHHGS